MAHSNQPTPVFSTGDLVRHPRRPEWGSGVVRSTTRVTQQGRTAQRLKVRFANKGAVTINTAVAPLTLESEQNQRQTNAGDPAKTGSTQANSSPGTPMTMSPFASTTRSNSTGQSGGWLGELERRGNTGQQSHELWELPEHLSDPFTSDEARLLATLETYKYSTDPRPLIDWAVVQTGLNDPLSKYTRVELEQAFPRYARDRDQHLQSLVRQIKQNDGDEVIRRVRRQIKTRAAISALDKALNR